MSDPSAADVALLLARAERVVVVPGYGLAVARAHHVLRTLTDLLIAHGADVVWAVHPVAGRLPGHLNALLDEAQVPHERQLEPAEADVRLRRADVALVVGANDVVNPAIGMPVLDVGRARAVVVLTRSVRPGFAGVDNDLLRAPGTALLLGDASATLTAVLAQVPQYVV